MRTLRVLSILIILVINLFAVNVIEYKGDFYSYRLLCYNDDGKFEIYKIQDIAFNNKTLFENKGPMIKGYEECVLNPKNAKIKKYSNDDIFKIIDDNEDFWEE